MKPSRLKQARCIISLITGHFSLRRFHFRPSFSSILAFFDRADSVVLLDNDFFYGASSVIWRWTFPMLMFAASAC